MRAERELGHDAEVAAAAAHGPEELGVLVGARRDALAVGEHDLGREQVVDRQAVPAREVTDAAAERQPADAGRRDDPARNREPVRMRRRVHLAPGRSSADANRARAGIDRDRAEQRQVGHDAVVDAPEAAAVVAAAAHRKRQVVRAGEGDHARHVRRARAARDHGRPLVDHRVEQRPRLVVARVVGPDQLALEPRAELTSSRNRNSSPPCSSSASSRPRAPIGPIERV